MRHRARLVRAAPILLLLLALTSACCNLVVLAADSQPQETTPQTFKTQDSNITSTSTAAPETSRQPTFEAASNCSRPCSNSEFASILNKISLNVDILREFQRGESAPASAAPPNSTTSTSTTTNNNRTSSTTRADLNTIRPECIKQLIRMIKNLAAGELEMKTLLEFASSAGQINTGLRSDLSYLRSKETSEAEGRQAETCRQQVAPAQATAGSTTTVALQQQQQQQPEYLLGDEVPGSAGELEAKMNFLPKLVASVDQWLDTIERFTVTREWSALTRVFTGLESILGMFSNAAAPASHAGASASKNAHANATSEMVAQLERELPRQVQTLTGSLNQLFPWHVWPWNNIDLYSTIDTFLNHGIFAFSKTTAGPERRIDFLPQMLEALFKSLEHDSFPKKCHDWSKIICDLELFYDRLALAPLSPDDTPTDHQKQLRQAQVRELTGNSKNKLTQELVCIMFSSLSMQQFGGSADLNATTLFDAAAADEQQSVAAAGSSAQAQQPLPAHANQLKWDRQIRKGLRLYRLSREALSDDQWRALQKQLSALWSQMKISDRVIMVGRIVQLLTNCHMPREILESALWKDIYKYKNALNQVSDIVIEELNRSAETGQFTIERLALGSKHLEEILVRFVKLLPRLIEALSRTVTDQLPELVGKFFDEKLAFFKGPCKGHSFGQLVPSLAPFHEELSHLERLVCQQLRTKPSITMMQINNLTNEILAMAFNFTNFGGSTFPGLPRLWSGPEQAGATGAGTVSASGSSSGPERPGEQRAQSAAKFVVPEVKRQDLQSNGTSIIDELAANPRLAQIVAILQSSALDPPEVHAELPELDWVEAGTSVALFYQSIQRLMSYEGLFVVFPEVANFQEDIGARLETSKQMFSKFGKRDPVRLAAYLLDTAMPVALRTFQPLDSFHSECLSTFRDIFGETESLASQSLTGGGGGQPLVSRESRQWQCAVSTTNFVSYALNNLIRTFNGMLRNILAQMSRQRDTFRFNKQQQQVGANSTSTSTNSTCVLFDGSVTTLMDNLPHLVDLALETVLIASTNFNQRLSLKETLCSFESVLDPLGEQQLIQRQLKLREAVCHLLHESSLATCSDALKVDAWTSTMKELNVTWFEMNALNVEPSFRGILVGVHEFMDLFGKVKPSSMSDGLIARVLNFKSYWTGLVNKAMSSFEKYKERRFQVALQILMPIIYENLPAFQQSAVDSDELKHGLRTSILAARSLLVYLSKSDAHNSTSSGNEPAQASVSASGSAPANGDAPDQEQIDAQLRALFDWSDRYSIVITETLLRTGATNIGKLESLNAINGSDWQSVWHSFCAQPIDTYLEFDLPAAASAAESGPLNKAGLPSHARLADMQRAREFICQFDWRGLERRLLAQAASNSSATPATNLDHYSTRQLVRVTLTKWGQVLDLVVASLSGGPTQRPPRLPKLLSLSHWQQLQERLPNIAPAEQDPSNFVWVWRALERLINQADQRRRPPSNETALVVVPGNSTSGARTSDALIKIFDQLNCALDTIKGGMTWENMVNIYQDRQDVLAAHSTLNNGIALASAGVNTFLAHKKFQKFLNSFVKPHLGLAAFCEMRDKTRLESVFSLDTNLPGDVAGDSRDRDELVAALESFQEFICDTNIESLVANVNPISVCYQNSSSGHQQQVAPPALNHTYSPLAETVERFFKLASLAILDAKLVDTNDARPPIFDKSHWDQLRTWWFNQTEVHQGNSGLALALVRVFQTLDSVNSEHVVWRAIFRSVHELSEVAAYLLRATEMERQANLEMRERGQPTRFALIREAAELVDGALKSPATGVASNSTVIASGLKFGRKHQQLASTLTNVMFPETSNFISLRTFKQLRYIKSISEYFATAPGAQEPICKNLTHTTGAVSNSTDGLNRDGEEEEEDQGAQDKQPLFAGTAGSKFELLDYKLNTSRRLYSLLCHYHSSQWLTAMNIVLSSKTSSLTKKVNYMTKYLSIFTKNLENNENLQSFIHGQQLENIEAVANKTVSYLIALSQPFRTLTLSKISNISWYSIPALLDSMDKHLCASKYEQQQQQSNSSSEQNNKNNTMQYATGDAVAAAASGYQLAVYEPKKPDIEVILCKLPSWNITQVYNYFSENIDLQNMISLATQDNNTAKLLGISVSTAAAQRQPVCITPFKFASKWLAIVQQLIDEAMSKASKDRIKKCLSLNKKGQSAYVQTMRYVRVLNSLLATLDDLVRNNSWPMVRKTWNSISFAILNQSGSTPLHLAQSALPLATNMTRLVSPVHD